MATLAGNKENVQPPRDPQKYYAQENTRLRDPHRYHVQWKHSWSHGANKIYYSKICNNRRPGHSKSTTLKDAKGGSRYKLHLPTVQVLLPKS